MGRNFRTGAALAALWLSGPGCVTTPDARYVYQDGEFGVIGIPRNSSLGKKDFREQAHHLMSLHFPEGFEIVRAEEVVEGERIFEAARKLELNSEPGLNALNQAIKIGKVAKSTAIDQKDTVHITESRIIYRRKPDGKSAGRDGFAAVATASPAFYIDPNEEVRKLGYEAAMLAKKEAVKARLDEKDRKLADAKAPSPKDPGLQRASHEGPAGPEAPKPAPGGPK